MNDLHALNSVLSYEQQQVALETCSNRASIILVTARVKIFSVLCLW
jgi:hypothetical protein